MKKTRSKMIRQYRTIRQWVSAILLGLAVWGLILVAWNAPAAAQHEAHSLWPYIVCKESEPLAKYLTLSYPSELMYRRSQEAAGMCIASGVRQGLGAWQTQAFEYSVTTDKGTEAFIWSVHVPGAPDTVFYLYVFEDVHRRALQFLADHGA